MDTRRSATGLFLILSALAFGLSANAANSAFSGTVFENSPKALAINDAQAMVDYQLPVPSSLPADATLVGAAPLLPSQLVMFPKVTDAAERDRLLASDRRRPVAVQYSTPRGSFRVFVAGLAYNESATDNRDTHPYGLERVTGVMENYEGTTFVVRQFEREGQQVTSICWRPRHFEWRGSGAVISVIYTLEGGLGKEELQRIALSIP